MSERAVSSTLRPGPSDLARRSRTAVRRLLRRVYSVRWKLFPPDYSRTYRLRLAGFDITVLPTVFHPSWHFTSSFFAEYCEHAPFLAGADVLEIGTGTGVVALAAARHARKVTAIDINRKAVECARQNAQRNGLEHKIEVLHGDMFDPAGGHAFDVILCNPPYFCGEARTDVERAYYGGRHLEWITRLAGEGLGYLKPGGRLVCVFGDVADIGLLVGLIEKEGWLGRRAATKQLPVEELSIWEFTPGKEDTAGI